MKTEIKQWLFNLCLKTVIKFVNNGDRKLTGTILKERGWEAVNAHGSFYWVEPNIKDRDKIWISFENHYYKVWHGKDRTFIALESSLEWFEVYYKMIHPDNRRSA